MNEKSADDDVRVTGLAVLDNELFMTTCNSNILLIRGLKNLRTLRRRVIIDDLHDPYDICSCPQNHCLYIFDKDSRKIVSIDKNGNATAPWSRPTVNIVGTLSVAEDSNVILILHEEHKLNEYNSDGGLVKEIELFKFGIDWPSHAVKLNSNYYVISHGDYRHCLQRVCLADVEVGATVRSFGEDLDWPIRREITPFYLAKDAEGYIMVADRKSNSVLLLTPWLEFDKVVIKSGDCFNRPEENLLAERFCLDEEKRLIVASNFKLNGRWACSVMSHKFY